MSPVPTAKHVPAIDAARIEEAGLNALQTQRQLFYDGWVLRLSPGSAKRARSVNAHFGSTLPLAHKIAYCQSVYARCDLPVLFRMTPFSKPTELERALVDAGYVAFDPTLVQAIGMDGPPALADVAEDVAIRAVDPATFVDAVGDLRGASAIQRAAHLERLRQSPLMSRMIVVQEGGDTVAAAQMAGEGGVAGVFDVVTAIEQRRRGHAFAAVATLMAWAYDHAFGTVYLQVNANNVAALALYRKLGFETVYTYHYMGRPETCR